jgi:hypothetical protein
VQVFRPTGGGVFLKPLEDGELVTRQIFDQDRPRSKMAQRLDEAFAGCEEWTVVAAPPRRDTLEVTPWVSPAGLGGETQAGQGRRERGVLRTRATEDAAGRRLAAA